jgi:DNA-directed RNA polymerase specialized sigma24 family protein
MSPHDFALLVDRHGPPLMLYARQWCDAPEDVVQDAFLKLVALRQPPREVVPWLYQVVRNAAIDATRSVRRRQKREAAQPARWFVEPDKGTPPAGQEKTASFNVHYEIKIAK